MRDSPEIVAEYSNNNETRATGAVIVPAARNFHSRVRESATHACV